ncbi:MAG: hypothetical protein PHE27_02865 [Alphaproteobacteria bacterium]|nr:hypothetical protein [Alphaproteobacteria bacterium]
MLDVTAIGTMNFDLPSGFEASLAQSMRAEGADGRYRFVVFNKDEFICEEVHNVPFGNYKRHSGDPVQSAKVCSLKDETRNPVVAVSFVRIFDPFAKSVTTGRYTHSHSMGLSRIEPDPGAYAPQVLVSSDAVSELFIPMGTVQGKELPPPLRQKMKTLSACFEKAMNPDPV